MVLVSPDLNLRGDLPGGAAAGGLRQQPGDLSSPQQVGGGDLKVPEMTFTVTCVALKSWPGLT